MIRRLAAALRELFRSEDWRGTGETRWHADKVVPGWRLEVEQAEQVDMNSGATRWVDLYNEGMSMATWEPYSERRERLVRA